MNISYDIKNCGMARLCADDGRMPEGWITDEYLKNNDRYRIWYVTEGKGNVTTIFGDIELLPGNLYFIPKFTIIRASCLNMTQYFIDFLTEEDEFLSRYQMIPYGACCTELSESLFEYVLKKWDMADKSAGVFRDAAITLLLSNFLDESKIKHKRDILTAVVEYLDASYYRPNISIEGVARQFHISTQHLERLFKLHHGISPKRYIINKRISYAQILLKNSEKSICEVALSCGFSDQLYFSRLFKKMVGATPTCFRKK